MTLPVGIPGPGDAAWDAFVAGAEQGSYLQLSAWARVKAVNGWRAGRLLVTDVPDGPIGAQVLVRRPRPLPWGFAYAPRGPVAASWSPAAVAAFSERARVDLPRLLGRISHLRIDPEIEVGGPHDRDGAMHEALRAAGWRPAPPVQPVTTRVIDLAADEKAIWGDLRSKWRQYVNKARTNRIIIVDAGSERLPDFHRIYRETADRAGFHIRTLEAYRDIWEAYAPAGNARLLFAQTAEGEPVATLFLVRCGPRVVEPYGGMTALGAESRANYLLKWEAIRSSKAAGATSYDLWGLAHPGIAQFKAGFGGREIAYIGAWDLVIDRAGRAIYGVAQAVSFRLTRRTPATGALPAAGETGDARETGGAA